MNLKENADKIQRIVDNGFAGTRDENTLNLLRREVGSVLSHPEISDRARGKLPELLKWADIYFSPRKHLGYPGGLNQVYTWMMESLDSARYSVPPDGQQKN